MAAATVLQFLEEHNRPFSCNDIQSGAKGEFGKAAIQKALDFLVGKEQVKEKVYGKQKVYCIVQTKEATGNELRDKLLEIDRAINETSIKLKDVSDQLKLKTNLIAEVKGKISLEEAVDQKLKLDKQLELVKKSLEQYSGTEIVCPKRKMEVEKLHEKYLNEYKKRKRMCMDIVDSILENYPKSKKQLFDELEIETDEDVGFHLENI